MFCLKVVARFVQTSLNLGWLDCWEKPYGSRCALGFLQWLNYWIPKRWSSSCWFLDVLFLKDSSSERITCWLCTLFNSFLSNVKPYCIIYCRDALCCHSHGSESKWMVNINSNVGPSFLFCWKLHSQKDLDFITMIK